MCYCLLLLLRVRKNSNQCLSDSCHIQFIYAKNLAQFMTIFDCFFAFVFPVVFLIILPKICDKINTFLLKNIFGLQRPSCVGHFPRLIFQSYFSSLGKKERETNKQSFRQSNTSQRRVWVHETHILQPCRETIAKCTDFCI